MKLSKFVPKNPEIAKIPHHSDDGLGQVAEFTQVLSSVIVLPLHVPERESAIPWAFSPARR